MTGRRRHEAPAPVAAQQRTGPQMEGWRTSTASRWAVSATTLGTEVGAHPPLAPVPPPLPPPPPPLWPPPSAAGVAA